MTSTPCRAGGRRGCLALYENRPADARGFFAEAHALLEPFERRTNHFMMSGLALASAELLDGEPERALDTLDTFDWSLSVWDSSPVIRGVALVELGRMTEAADLVVGYGYDALRGRLARMANDAVVGFAALAIARGEVDHAWMLLQQAAAPRTPFTIGLAEGLADRIGHGEELRAIHRGRDRPLSEMDASPALRVELERIRRAR